MLFGATGLFPKIIDMGPASLAMARSAIAAVFVLVVAKAMGRTIGPRRPIDLVTFGVAGTILAVHWSAFFQAVQTATVSLAVITAATFPVFTALLGPVVDGGRPRPIDVGLATVALVGVAIMVGEVDVGAAATQGVLWGLLAAVLFAVLTLINEALIADYQGEVVALYQYGVAAAVLAPFVAGGVRVTSTADGVALVAFGTLFTGVAHTLFITSMRAIPASTASLAVSLEPVYGVVLAWLLLDERLELRFLIGATVILVAVAGGSMAATRPPSPRRGR